MNKVERSTMARCMFVVGPAGTDAAKTRNVYLKDGRVLVAHMFQPDGPKCGYKFRIIGRQHASSLYYKTMTKACLSLGAVL